MRTDIVDTALAHIGVREVPGIENNSRIVQMLRLLLPWAQSDSINWCSAFVAYVAKQLGYEHERANAAARSWLAVGEKADYPVPGDIVVFWRVSRWDWRGHVGFYLGEVGDKIVVLGGNQGDAVRISEYPKNRLLGYRKLIKKHPPQT